MSADEFRELVRRMRMKQKEYFASRTHGVLNECKDLERRVDKALEDKTPDLFGDGQADAGRGCGHETNYG